MKSLRAVHGWYKGLQIRYRYPRRGVNSLKCDSIYMYHSQWTSSQLLVEVASSSVFVMGAALVMLRPGSRAHDKHRVRRRASIRRHNARSQTARRALMEDRSRHGMIHPRAATTTTTTTTAQQGRDAESRYCCQPRHPQTMVNARIAIGHSLDGITL